MATAYTTVSGQTVETFDVEILGVLDDGIAPGIDFILVQASGPLIDDTGGVAAGFSGSPVMMEGDLVGAISYGFWAADQTIAGVTPAEAMLPLFDLPDGTTWLAPEVTLSPDLRRAAAEATGHPVSSIPGSMQQLPIPLSISGAGPQGITKLQHHLDRRALPVIAHVGGVRRAPTPLAPSLPAPGQPLAAVLSYGDVTFAGVGTLTATCGNLAVAFGHPFDWSGSSKIGMHEASVVRVVKDPSEIRGPFRLSNIGTGLGVVDQDRIAGIRGIEGLNPELVPVTSTLTNIDLGTIHPGRTDVAESWWMPIVGGFHLALSIWMANDTWWEGTADIAYAIDGMRENGDPFSFSYRDIWYDAYDVGFLWFDRLWGHLRQLQDQGLEDIRITGIDIQGRVSERRLEATIVKLRTKTRHRPTMIVHPVLRVRQGETIHAEVVLDPRGPGPNEIVRASIKVPSGVRGNLRLVVGGGADWRWSYGSNDYYYYYDYGGSQYESFDDLLESMTSGLRNNLVVMQLVPSRLGVQITERARREVRLERDEIVRGTRSAVIRIIR